MPGIVVALLSYTTLRDTTGMPIRRKLFQLTDIPKFASPDLSNLDPGMTAGTLADRLGAGGFRSCPEGWCSSGVVKSPDRALSIAL